MKVAALVLAASALAAEPRYRVDLSPLDPVRMHSPLTRLGWSLCGTGDRGVPLPEDAAWPEDASGERAVGAPWRVLGAAVLIYSKKSGISSWGHTSWRFLACREHELVDLEFEYYAFSRESQEGMPELFPDRSFATDAAYLRSQRGRLFLFRNEGSSDFGYLGEALAENREIYELWLDLPDEELVELFSAVNRRYAEQLARMDRREPLPQPYQALGRNCTTGLQLHLGGVRGIGRVFPFAYLRHLWEEAPGMPGIRLAVFYPSHHALQRLTELHGGVEAGVAALSAGQVSVEPMHPVFRRPAALGPELRAALDRHAPRVLPAVEALVEPDAPSVVQP